MAVLKALRQTPGSLQRNPVLFVPPLVLLLFEVPQMILQAIDPLLASVVSLLLSLAFVFVLPFFQGGIIGMADEALDGRTSLHTFVRAGRSSYVSLLVAYLVLVVANVVLSIVAFFLAIPIGFVFFSDGRGGSGFVLLAVVAGIAAIVGLAYLLFVFLIQFYGQAIVIDGVGASDGLKRSVSVVRHHLVSTLGYSILVAILGGIAGIVFAVASALLSPRSSTAIGLPHLSTAGVAGAIVVMLLLGSLFGGFFGVYSVAFYRTVADRAPRDTI
ncbi:MAG: hypothetical protein ABEJ82_02060 [Haloplanus sp.]